MEYRTSLSPNQAVFEFFKEFWPLIGYDYSTMISKVASFSKFSIGLRKGLIVFLYKRLQESEDDKFAPYNITQCWLQIFANALQLRL